MWDVAAYILLLYHSSSFSCYNPNPISVSSKIALDNLKHTPPLPICEINIALALHFSSVFMKRRGQIQFFSRGGRTESDQQLFSVFIFKHLFAFVKAVAMSSCNDILL